MGEKKIIAYKGFDNNLQCRGFQYKVGETYEQENKATDDEGGFNAWSNPLDVLKNYGIGVGKRFCVVEQCDKIDFSKRYEFNTRQYSSKIKIKEEIGAIGLFKAYIQQTEEKDNLSKFIEKSKGKSKVTNLIYSDTNYASIPKDYAYFTIGSVGKNTKISSNSLSVEIASSGEHSRISVCGLKSQVASSGNCSIIASSGKETVISSNGDNTTIALSGEESNIASSGINANIASSGKLNIIASSGKNANIATSGLAAKIGSSGDNARISSSGIQYDNIVSSGNSSRIATNATLSQVESLGDDSIILCGGHNSMAKAKVGSWITLSEWEYSEKKGRHIPKCVKTEYVDGKRIKGDTWYWLKDGEFKEVNI